METLINYACAHAAHAHWVLFLLLLIAGLNIPISEDAILIFGGIIAGTCLTESALHLFIWLYAGCVLSAWEAYGIGRYFGPRLYTMPWFRKFISKKKINKLHYYYEKFGVFTFIIGRFIPGGVRNALFMTAGLGKMPFKKFALRDGFACLLSASTIYLIGYTFAQNYDIILYYMKKYNEIALLCLALIIGFILYKLWRKPDPETRV